MFRGEQPQSSHGEFAKERKRVMADVFEKGKEEYKGWIAKFDWLIRESTLRRMLGGGYAPSGAGKKEGR